MHMRVTFAVAFTIGLIGLTHIAHANEPVAIVEDITASNASVQIFDYVSKDQVVQLGSDDTMVIGYFASCRREAISGGKVTIGADRSTVEGGTIKPTLVECDGGQLQLSGAEAGESGVLVMRKAPEDASGTMPQIDLTIYGTAPIFRLSENSGSIMIERLDRPRTVLEFTMEHGQTLDLASTGQNLDRGGLYRASTDNNTIVFRIYRLARPGKLPLLSRLVPL